MPSTMGTKESGQRAFIWPLLVVVLSLIAAALIFNPYLLSPNQYMRAFGGDPYVLYYDMLYHTRYGAGTTLDAMNYPYGEYIFLTDMQGALTLLLQWIHHHIMPVGDHTVGITHGLNLYLLPLCSLMVFYILDYFRVRKAISVPFAVLITFLSPAMLRFGNHFGLAYPFVIPMAMLWFLRKYRHPRPEWRDLGVIVVLLFFTFNNPYIGLGASAFLVSAAGITWLTGVKDRDQRRTSWITGGAGLLVTLIPYLAFHVQDPVLDRLKQQWGFFYYCASIPGLLFPQGSFVFDILLQAGVKVKPIETEQHLNIGLVSTLLLIGISIQWVVGLLKKQKNRPLDAGIKEKRILFYAGTCVFIFAAAGYFFSFAQEWMEEHLGPLLMFKAAGRIGWSFYFVLTVMGVLFLDQKLKQISAAWIRITLILLLAAVWIWEISLYISVHYRDSNHANFFHRDKEKEITDLLHQHQVRADEYQAMLVLPKMMAWSDMFLSDINWAAQFYSMRISAATGLPMVSSMLSRMSTLHFVEGMQMLADPLIEKKRISQMTSDKDLLLLVGSGFAALTPGEQYLIDISTPLYQSPDFSLYRLPFARLKSHPRIQAAQDYFTQTSSSASPYLHLDFDDTPASFSFYGDGSKHVPAGEYVILDGRLPEVPDTQFVFSAWTRLKPEDPGFSDWFIRVSDTTGTAIATYHIETRRENDIQDMWVRNDIVFSAGDGFRVEAIFKTNKAADIDEVMIYPADSSTIVNRAAETTFLFNGYKIEKPK